MLKPNFFLIGAPRSGTTALCKYLQEHPNIYFCNPKEPGYFAHDLNLRLIEKEEDYLALFDKADPRKHRAVGEGSTIYLYSEVAVRRISEFQPDAKYIVMLRNPIELVQSLHAHHVASGVEEVCNIDQALNMENERKSVILKPSKLIPDHRLLLYTSWAMHGGHIKRLFQQIDRTQVKVIIYDDFVSDNGIVYRDVCNFLGVGDDGRRDFEKVNASVSTKSILISQALNIFHRILVKNIRYHFNYHKPTGLADAIRGLNGGFASGRQRITEQTRLALRRVFCDDVLLLSEMLGRDLTFWIADK